MTPDFYQHYPRLFSNYFKFIDNNSIEELSKAGYFYYQSILHTDTLIDDKDFSVIPTIQKFQESSIKLLTSIFGINSDFWNYWEKRRFEYFEAVKNEKKLSYEKEVSLSDYEALADKKSAFGKIAIDSLWLISNKQNSKPYKDLLLSHYYFSIGFQMYDDVKDFREDLEKGQFNWAVKKLKETLDFEKYDTQTLNKLLFLKDIGQNILKDSISYFDKAINLLLETKIESEWLETIIKMKSTIEHYLDVTNGYIMTLEKKIEIETSKTNKINFIPLFKIKDDTFLKGLNFIQKDFNKNFSELKHFMYLSKLEGFENKEQIHYSDTFQRAMINDCLFHITEKFKIDSINYYQSEIKYLLEKTNKDKIGAWSYFPTVKEIAADIDDLGQIIQLFIMLNRYDLIEKYCKNAIELILKERISSNGGIETWIIPKNHMTKIQKIQDNFNCTKWGKGPDVEVVANFVYALYMLNHTKYETYIKNALEYIISQQNIEGFWKSRWYYGKYYGTYVCLRLLKKFEERYSNHIKLSINFLIKSQNKDGGFYSEDNTYSDPLNTSFALNSIHLFKDKYNIDKQIENAKLFLIKSQNSDGSWIASPFIKPKAQEPYKSKTLTTAFVLKSLC